MQTVKTTWKSATTYAKGTEVCYRWTIRNISYLLIDTHVHESSYFQLNNNAIFKFCCSITHNDGCLKFGLSLEEDYYTYSPTRIPCEFKFSLIGPKGEVTLAGPHNHIFQYGEFEHYVDSLLTKTKMFEYKTNPGDTLTIVCQVRAILGSTTTDTKPTTPPETFSIPAGTMQHDLETILKGQQFTDVSLVVEGRSIKAHKAILSTRSPIFAAMFSTDMEESRQNQVTITDMEYEVAQKLLQFIYTGKTDIASKTVDQLLVAADKYGLMRLKAQCEQSIFNALTVPTAIKTLIFADRMNTRQLKSHTVKFIKTNMDKVVKSADWKTMAVEHPTLLVEVCRTLESS